MPKRFEPSLRRDQITASETMLTHRRCYGCGNVFMVDPRSSQKECGPGCQYETVRLNQKREMELKTFQSVSESVRQDMVIRVNEAISASFRQFTAETPSPSFTVPSSLSADSLLTRFSSTTSARNSGSNRNSSRSGPPKLLCSPSKATATKNFTPNSKGSFEQRKDQKQNP